MFVMSSASGSSRRRTSEDAREVSGYLRRASQLAIESASTIASCSIRYRQLPAEVCQASHAVAQLRKDEEKQKRELSAQEKLKDLPADTLRSAIRTRRSSARPRSRATTSPIGNARR
jgi:hypothetical protein